MTREIHKTKIPSSGPSHRHMEKTNTPLTQDSEAADSEDELYLSNKYPYFEVVLTKNQVENPCHLDLPADFRRLLPNSSVPVDLRCGRKNWNITCSSNGGNPSFRSGWETFVKENDLKIGDACVFELRDRSELKKKFKVVILRSELPQELKDVSLTFGLAPDNPIEIE